VIVVFEKSASQQAFAPRYIPRKDSYVEPRSISGVIQLQGLESQTMGKISTIYRHHLGRTNLILLSRTSYVTIYQMDTLPLGSYGNSNARKPANTIRPPAIYTGTAVARFAYSAMTGAYGRHSESIPSTSNTLTNGNTYQDAKHTLCSPCQTVSCATILGWEYLCRERIEHAVHNLLSRSSNELG